VSGAARRSRLNSGVRPHSVSGVVGERQARAMQEDAKPLHSVVHLKSVAVFLTVSVLGLLAGVMSIPCVWTLICSANPSSESVTKGGVYAAALIDAIFCVRLFRWSRLFIICFAVAAVLSFWVCLLIAYMPPDSD
jgi:hypothetical protein